MMKPQNREVENQRDQVTADKLSEHKNDVGQLWIPISKADKEAETMFN